jgi:hypothetical protein
MVMVVLRPASCYPTNRATVVHVSVANGGSHEESLTCGLSELRDLR